MRNPTCAFIGIALLSASAAGCGSHKPQLYTEAHSRACLTKLTAQGGSYEPESVNGTIGSVRLTFHKPTRKSQLQVDVEFWSNEDVAKKMTKGTPAGWRHPSPGMGVEIYRRANVLVFWHQGTNYGPAPTSAEQQAVDDCLS